MRKIKNRHLGIVGTQAVTLIELLIAMSIFSFIALSAVSIGIFSYHHTVDTDRRTELQNEASFVLEHMTKHMVGAIGSMVDSDPAVVPYVEGGVLTGFRVRIDDLVHGDQGMVDNQDEWIAYRVPPSTFELVFYPEAKDGNLPVEAHKEVLTNRVPEGGFIFEVIDNFVNVTLTVRWNPAEDVLPNNPEVKMTTGVSMPSVSAS
ncbi:MAG: hypothetical protein DRP74_05990 [Candidatus Omnitrophota bacterium]|mgnify:CR=1 FL=1|nr:MAG: hypothetical protein DRP74_05990 [Candidatus Omnitrophota bacterium]